MVYQRGRCCVAVIITRRDHAKIEEGNLIQRLMPRDNLVTDPAGRNDDDDEIPF